jgi:plasmid stabilization system protein ParE
VTDRVLGSLLDSLTLLSASPGIGHRRPDLTDDERLSFWSVGPTLIVYRRVDDGIDVLAIERADLDWRRILDQL